MFIYVVCVGLQANGIEMHPVYLIFPVALAVNFSFILPVSTPGNAIVYSYGDITVPDMVSFSCHLCMSCLYSCKNLLQGLD